MSRYLVTGPAGFLGRHLVHALVTRGYDVVALCRHDPGPPFGSERVEVKKGDVLDAAAVEAAAKYCDGVFHCAGRVSRRPEDAEMLFRVHVEGTKTVLDACKSAGVRRAVVASTSGTSAVSDAPEPRDESAEPPMDIIGSWPYYRSKLYAERAALERSEDGFEVVVVSPTLLLGPGDFLGSSTGDVAKIVEERLPVVPGGGLSFVDARDAAEAMVLAMERGRASERYLVSAKNMTLDAFCQRIARVAGARPPRLKAPRSVLFARAGAELLSRASRHLGAEPPLDRIGAEMAQYFWYVDAAKAQNELGWEPRDPNETLSDTVEDLRSRGVVWPRASG